MKSKVGGGAFPRSGKAWAIAIGIAWLCSVAASVSEAQAAEKTAREPSTLTLLRADSPDATEAPAGRKDCLPGLIRAKNVATTCPRLPKKVVPWALRVHKPSAFGSGGTSGVEALVTSPAGDELEVLTALPSTPYVPPFKKDCRITFPYLGAAYNPCGYVTFYDQKWATSQKAPDTNIEEDAEYDACGNPVSSGKTFGWHVIGTNYTLSGWHAGHEPKVLPHRLPVSASGP